MRPPAIEVGQYKAQHFKDYMRMSTHATEKSCSPFILSAAIELRRLHGVAIAAAYLRDNGIAIEVAVELLAAIQSRETAGLSAQHSSSQACILRVFDGA